MKGILLIGDDKQLIQKGGDFIKLTLNQAGLDADIVSVRDITVISENDFDGYIYVKGEKMPCPEVVMFAAIDIFDDYETQAVMRMFESLGVLCINPNEAMQKAGDKLYTYQIAAKAVPEIRIPKTILVTKNTTAKMVEDLIGYPAVLKIMHGYGGKGVSLIKTAKEMENMLSMLFASNLDDQVIVQQAITASPGRDLRIVIRGGEVITSFVRCNDSDFRSNVAKGGYIEPYDAPDSLKEASLKLIAALGLKQGSIDYLFGDEGEYYLCEANAMPGITYLSNEKDSGGNDILTRYNDALKRIMDEHVSPAWKH